MRGVLSPLPLTFLVVVGQCSRVPRFAGAGAGRTRRSNSRRITRRAQVEASKCSAVACSSMCCLSSGVRRI